MNSTDSQYYSTVALAEYDNKWNILLNTPLVNLIYSQPPTAAGYHTKGHMLSEAEKKKNNLSSYFPVLFPHMPLNHLPFTFSLIYSLCLFMTLMSECLLCLTPKNPTHLIKTHLSWDTYNNNTVLIYILPPTSFKQLVALMNDFIISRLSSAPSSQ